MEPCVQISAMPKGEAAMPLAEICTRKLVAVERNTPID